MNVAIDPVCKMEVDEKTARFKTEYKGETYYFCAPGCKKAFEENPEEYVGWVQGQRIAYTMLYDSKGKVANNVQKPF